MKVIMNCLVKPWLWTKSNPEDSAVLLHLFTGHASSLFNTSLSIVVTLTVHKAYFMVTTNNGLNNYLQHFIAGAGVDLLLHAASL